MDRIKKLLESSNGEDQLVGLTLLLGQETPDISFIPMNHLDTSMYMKNKTGIEGYVTLGDVDLLLGCSSIRRIKTVSIMSRQYKELNKNLDYV